MTASSRRFSLSRRRLLTAAASLGAGVIAAPYVARADEAVLNVTGWGGKWGEVMKAEIGPTFETEFKCRLKTDTALPFLPKLQASSRSAPVYDVLHTNSNEQWAAVEMGLVEPKVDPRLVPNIADVYPYAVSDKIVGVCIFTSAIGLGMRTDKGYGSITSWKEFWDAKFNGARGGYVIPANSLGQAFVMMCGTLFGKGQTDLDAAYAALEKLKPIKLVDFTGAMEKLILSGEAGIGTAVWQRRATRLEVLSETAIAFITIISAQRRIEIFDEQIASFDPLIPLLQKRVQEGASSPAETLRAQVAADLFRVERERSKTLLATARRDLAILMGDASPRFGEAVGRLATTGQPPPFKAVLQAIDANPQLARWPAVTAERNAELLIARLKAI
ncbi:MAG: TolC family protein, partial [Bradyrhizobium sp.]|nr:TolC family protein [Bradyrhizobium sp.]